MDIKSQAQLIRDFINQYSPMWSNEIMNSYPESVEFYPREWIELLDSLSSDELYEIDCKKINERINGSSFASFMQAVLELCILPIAQKDHEISLEDWAFNGVKQKKKHEIQIIAPILKKLKEINQFEYIVDIGGGVGHLSRILSHYHSIPSISLDRDAYFQHLGFERLKKYRRIAGSAEVKFVTINFGNDIHEAELKKIFTPKAFSLGLHTCGALANILIEKSISHKTAGLLSFGCCYHSLNPVTDYPLSAFYKENHFPQYNLYALTLATRSHAEMSRETYDTKERVKYYRYALHLFFTRHFGDNAVIDVGECPIKIYWGSFADYIKLKLSELKIEHHFSDEYFNLFYQDHDLQKELRVMFLCNIIRWQLGRVLEISILLDRGIFLEENNYDVCIEQYFNEPLSPRNIGIMATKKKDAL